MAERQCFRCELGNLFRLLPALKFGAFFAAILLMAHAAATLGAASAYWTSALGGSIDPGPGRGHRERPVAL